MPNWGAYAEAERRGILTPDKQALYAEAKKRGLVPGMEAVSGEKPIQPSTTDVGGGFFETLATPESFEIVDALREATLNAPASAYDYAKNIYTALRHPIQTTKAMGTLVKGAGQAFVGSEGEARGFYLQFEEAMRDRYGGKEAFLKTLSEDPVGVLADVATILTPVKAGGALEPTNIAMRAAALPLKLIPEKAPIHYYQRAVKFGTTLSVKQKNAITKTALDTRYQIMPTVKGFQKLRGIIDKYNEDVNKLLNRVTATGKEVHVNDLYAGLDKVKNQMKRTTDQPRMVEAAFSKMKREWKEALEVGETRTPQEVQRLKQKVYKDLESLYEQHKTAPAYKKLRMEVARNARRILEELVPEIKRLNTNEGALIELSEALEKVANRISNREVVSLGMPVKTGVGGYLGYRMAGEAGGTIGSTIGFFMSVFDVPQVKAKFALVLNRLREKGIKIRPTPAAIRLGLYQAGRTQEIIKEEE